MARLTGRPRKPCLVLVQLANSPRRSKEWSVDRRPRSRVICIYGGTSYNVGARRSTRVDVVVRAGVEDMLERAARSLGVTTVVVDEADRMADMGFLPCVRRMSAPLP